MPSGCSMQGIAQTIAIEHPDRMLSLTSMMSTTGDMTVGQPHAAVRQTVCGGPPAITREQVVDGAVRALSALRRIRPIRPISPNALASPDIGAIVRRAVLRGRSRPDDQDRRA
jgi:hypothetical protein